MNWLTGIREFIEERLDDLREWYSHLIESEEETEAFDEEKIEIKRIEDDIDELEKQLEEIEDTEIELSFPSWVDENTMITINEELGIFDYEEMTDAEKDTYINGWRSFEGADVPAEFIDSDKMSEFREEIQVELGIPEFIINQMTDNELLQLITISQGETIIIGREILQLEPDILSAQFGIDFRGEFEDWSSFIQSHLYEFIQERPDLFEVYITNEGNIEIYETYIGN
jgi:hypothetical protein